MAPPKVAVVAHVFDFRLWPELSVYLRNIPGPFTLFATIVSGAEARPITADYPNAVIVEHPNVGRDVAPFLSVLPRLRGFDVILKIHSKSNATWRAEALRCLLNSPDSVAAILRAFQKELSMGFAGPREFWADGPIHLGKNAPLLPQLVTELDLFPGELPPRYSFFMGTMFWARADRLRRLESMRPLRFVKHDDEDGHPEHAIERLFGLLAIPGMVGLLDAQGRGELVSATSPAVTMWYTDAIARLRARYGLPA